MIKVSAGAHQRVAGFASRTGLNEILQKTATKISIRL